MRCVGDGHSHEQQSLRCQCLGTRPGLHMGTNYGRASRFLNIRTYDDAADEESLAWIPGRLMLEASRDAAFGRTLLNGPFKDGIFPAKLSDAAAAHHWVAIYQV